MTPPSFPRLTRLIPFVLASLFVFHHVAAAYDEYHPGLAVEWVGTADGVISGSALGDGDADGFPDLFVLTGGQLQLWRNNGQGAFATRTTIVASLPLQAIAIADLDHDGHIDVLGTPAGAPGIVFVRGLGGGRFDNPVVLPTAGVAYWSLVPLDPAAQELIANRAQPASGFDLLRRDGDVYVTVAHALEGEDLWAPIAADVDGDGAADVIVSAPGQAVEVMLRRGDAFEHVASLSDSPGIVTLATTDLDGDGDRDIIGGDEIGAVTLFFNAGDGRQWSGVATDLWRGTGTAGIAAADVDQDGRDELFVGVRWSTEATYIAEYQCVDDPMLQSPSWHSYMFTEQGEYAPENLLSGDLNGDGRQDLVAINSGPHRGMVGTILTRPNGQPGAIRILSTDVGVTPARFHAVGASDLLLFRPDGLAVAKFTPDGTIGPARPIGAGIGASVVDLDADGLDDLVVSMGGGQLEVRLTGPDGLPDVTTAHLTGTVISTGDLDHDERPELLLQGTDGRLSVAWSDPHARFRRITSLSMDATSPWARYVIADVDGDGRGELVTIVHRDVFPHGPAQDSVQTWRALPSGQVKPLRLSLFEDLIEPEHTLDGVQVGELDGRAGQDIVLTAGASGFSGSYARELLGRPDGSFVVGAMASLFGEGPTGPLIADLDGDGDNDVVGGSSIEGSYAILHICWNDGRGDLSETWSRRIAGAQSVVANSGDLDGDGMLDLLIGVHPYESFDDATGQIATLYGRRKVATSLVTRSVTSPVRVATVQGAQLSALAVTPNPASGAFEARWSTNNQAPVSLELIDLAGRSVRTAVTIPISGSRATFDHLENLSPGIYWIRARQGQTTATQRIVLVR